MDAYEHIRLKKEFTEAVRNAWKGYSKPLESFYSLLSSQVNALDYALKNTSSKLLQRDLSKALENAHQLISYITEFLDDPKRNRNFTLVALLITNSEIPAKCTKALEDFSNALSKIAACR